MKKIYWVGDLLNDTGPAIVNKQYYRYLNDKISFCFTNNKILRSFDFLFHLPFTKVVVISGFSKLNYIISKISKIFLKKVIYIMHGYSKIEKNFDSNIEDKKIKIEYCLLKNVDKIVCVSENFSNYLKNDLPELKDKITFVNSGIEEKKYTNSSRNNGKLYRIISVGGGVKIKENLKVCEALSKIKNLNIEFIVIGKISEDGLKIKKFPFVKYYENLSHDEVLKKMTMSNLYIQNSYSETFGLAIAEAISCGCDILISKNVGIISIIDNIQSCDIIYQNNDISEIQEKIENKIKSKGQKRKPSIDYDVHCWKNCSIEMLKVIGE